MNLLHTIILIKIYLKFFLTITINYIKLNNWKKKVYERLVNRLKGVILRRKHLRSFISLLL